MERSKRVAYPDDPTCVQYYAPGHLARDSGLENSFKLAATYIAFNASGSEMLVNLGGEQIYLFDINNARSANIMRVPQQIVERNKSGTAEFCCCDVRNLGKKIFFSLLFFFFYLQDATVSQEATYKLNGNSCVCDYIARASTLFHRKWYVWYFFFFFGVKL